MTRTSPLSGPVPPSDAGLPLARTSLADLVYERLLEGILAGRLTSGIELNVSDLAREFGVSPSPVREGLLKLAAHGLVHSATHRRATVISFSRQEVIDLFQVRELLEAGAAALAAVKIQPPQVERLRQVAEGCGALYGRAEQKKDMLDLDNQFHLLIADATGNASLKADIVRYSQRVRIVQCLHLAPTNMRNAEDEHLQILNSIAAGDSAGARQAMSHHLHIALEYVLQGLDRSGR